MKRLLVLGSLIFLVVALVLTGCVGKKPNNPPQILEKSLEPTTVTVNQEVQLSYKVKDPDNDPVTVTVDWGDNTSSEESALEAVVTHKYNSEGTYSVYIKVDDGKEAVKEFVGTVNVTSGVPQIEKFSIEEGSFFEGETIAGTIMVLDNEATLNAWVYWDARPEGLGFGSKEIGVIPSNEPYGFEFSIPSAGEYYIWVKVVDGEGNVVQTREYEDWVVKRKILENHAPKVTIEVSPLSGPVDTMR